MMGNYFTNILTIIGFSIKSISYSKLEIFNNFRQNVYWYYQKNSLYYTMLLQVILRSLRLTLPLALKILLMIFELYLKLI